jgi:hypothetical protein
MPFHYFLIVGSIISSIMNHNEVAFCRSHNIPLLLQNSWFLLSCEFCRPMYHYDPATGGIPPGFPSAINLSVKCVAAAQAQAQMKSSEPTSPGGSVMDLSTSSVTSTSPQVRTLCSPSSVVCFSPFYHFLVFPPLWIWQCVTASTDISLHIKILHNCSISIRLNSIHLIVGVKNASWQKYNYSWVGIGLYNSR